MKEARPQKSTYCLIPFLEIPKNIRKQDDRKQDNEKGERGWGGHQETLRGDGRVHQLVRGCGFKGVSICPMLLKLWIRSMYDLFSVNYTSVK